MKKAKKLHQTVLTELEYNRRLEDNLCMINYVLFNLYFPLSVLSKLQHLNCIAFGFFKRIFNLRLHGVIYWLESYGTRRADSYINENQHLKCTDSKKLDFCV